MWKLIYASWVITNVKKLHILLKSTDDGWMVNISHEIKIKRIRGIFELKIFFRMNLAEIRITLFISDCMGNCHITAVEHSQREEEIFNPWDYFSLFNVSLGLRTHRGSPAGRNYVIEQDSWINGLLSAWRLRLEASMRRSEDTDTGRRRTRVRVWSYPGSEERTLDGSSRAVRGCCCCWAPLPITPLRLLLPAAPASDVAISPLFARWRGQPTSDSSQPGPFNPQKYDIITDLMFNSSLSYSPWIID